MFTNSIQFNVTIPIIIHAQTQCHHTITCILMGNPHLQWDQMDERKIIIHTQTQCHHTITSILIGKPSLTMRSNGWNQRELWTYSHKNKQSQQQTIQMEHQIFYGHYIDPLQWRHLPTTKFMLKGLIMLVRLIFYFSWIFRILKCRNDNQSPQSNKIAPCLF